MIVVPPAGAALPSVTVPVAEVPPMTEEGEIVRLNCEGGLIVSDAVWVTPPWVADRVAVVAVVTLDVETPKLAEVEPAGTTTVEGTVALELLDDILTERPPVGALPLSVTVPVAAPPPVTVDGDKATELIVGGLTVSEAV